MAITEYTFILGALKAQHFCCRSDYFVGPWRAPDWSRARSGASPRSAFFNVTFRLFFMHRDQQDETVDILSAARSFLLAVNLKDSARG